MAKIIIKKRVSLSFLGEEHRDDYLTFSSIPVKEFRKLIDSKPDDEDGGQVDFIVDILKDRFVEGKFLGEAVAKEDIGDFDAESIVACFGRLTGQDPDPKV